MSLDMAAAKLFGMHYSAESLRSSDCHAHLFIRAGAQPVEPHTHFDPLFRWIPGFKIGVVGFDCPAEGIRFGAAVASVAVGVVVSAKEEATCTQA